MISMRERYVGAALCKLLGDAAWARFENRKRALIETTLSREGGLVPCDYHDPWRESRGLEPKIITVGHPTDDCELTAANMDSVGRPGKFSASRIFLGIRKFIILREPYLVEGDAYGIGQTLKASTTPETYQKSVLAFSRGEIPIFDTNGALMCVLAVPARYQGKTPLIVKYARWASCITHMHPYSQACCIAYSVWLSQVFDGLDPATAWEQTKNILTKPSYAKIPFMQNVLALPTTEPTDAEIWPHTGSVMLTMRVALWASLSATDLMDGIIKAGRIGGDTDTYGCVAGGILGAHFGPAAIPQEWLAVLQGKEKMIRLAHRLYSLAHPSK